MSRIRRFLPFWLALPFFFLSSCKSGDKKEILSASTGRIDEVLGVCSGENWSNPIGKAAKKMLQSAYPALPQPETFFDVNRIPFSSFNKLFKKASTIILMAPLNDGTDLSDLILRYRDETAKSVDLRGKHFFALRNIWSEPQQVIFVYGDDPTDLLSYLEKEPKQLVRTVSKIENDKALKNFYASGRNGDFAHRIKEKLSVDIPIPKSYREVILQEDLAWFRQDVENAIENILIQTSPISSSGAFNKALPINIRDGLGRLVSTDKDNSQMVTDTLIGVDQKMTTIDGMPCIETRGLWKMTKDFMGGPFINYCIQDSVNNRYVTIDMFVYAPHHEKRRYIRRFEVFGKELKL